MSLTQNNFDYAHCSHRSQLRLHSHHLHTKQKTTLTLMSLTQHTSPFPRQQSCWNHIKQSVFTAKSQDFLSFLYINNNQTTPEQCHISSETTLKSHREKHRKSIFKSQNYIEKHTSFEQSVKKHRKAVKHSKFFYKNWETFLGEKFGWKDERFSIKNLSDKGRKLFFRHQKQAKSPLFSRVLTCFRSTWNGRSKSNCSTWNIGCFLRFSPLYIPLLSRFYLFYIHIIVLSYIAF